MFLILKMLRTFRPLSLKQILMVLIISFVPAVRLDCVPLVPRQGIDVICTLPPEPVAFASDLLQTRRTTDCFTSYVPEGTIASFTCSKYYIGLIAIEQLPNELICTNMSSSGVSKWIGLDLYQSFTCQLDCGRSSESDDITTFIIKGNVTDSEIWPWHASIYKITAGSESSTTLGTGNDTNQTVADALSTSTYHCGGTLIHAFRLGFVILTAAHCFLAEDNSEGNGIEPFHVFQVVLGGRTSSMEENLMNPNAQIFSVEQMYLHELYSPSDDTHLHDIAILKMYEPVLLSQWVRPACMSSSSKLVDKMLKDGNKGEVIGFGRRDESHTPSPTLMHALIPVVDKLECFEHLNRDLDGGQICAGYLSEKTSVCSGDSGGGFVFPFTEKGITRYYVQGVVSYGYKNCEKYAVFTKVMYYLNWMRFGLESMFEQQEDNQGGGGDTGPESLQAEVSTITSIPQPSCPSIEEAEAKCDCSSDTGNKKNDENSSEDPNPLSHIGFIASLVGHVKNSTRPLSLPPVKVSHEIEYPDYQAVALALHNHYRFLHGSPPVHLNPLLNLEAKRYADKLIYENTFVNFNDHPSNPSGLNYIKNIFELKEYNKVRPTQPSQVIRQAIEHWYSDIAHYNWYSPSTSTFSQVVWKSTKEIGVGFAIATIPPSPTTNNNGLDSQSQPNSTSNFRTVVVVAYSPPGNTIGAEYHRANVSPIQQAP